MPLVKVKEKFQITLPVELREVLHLAVGDLLEATIEDNVIVLKPKAVVDRTAAWNRVIDVLDRVHATMPPSDKATSMQGCAPYWRRADSTSAVTDAGLRSECKAPVPGRSMVRTLWPAGSAFCSSAGKPPQCRDSRASPRSKTQFMAVRTRAHSPRDDAHRDRLPAATTAHG